MAELLVQSNSRRVALLPALPEVWKSGSVRGLRIQGNASIDISWQGGVLGQCQIHAASDLDTLIQYGEVTRPLRIEAGESAVFTADDFHLD